MIDWLLTARRSSPRRACSRGRSSSDRRARSLVARGREVILVGAGDAAQLMLQEMLKTPSLGYTPIGLIDDDPRKKNLRVHGIRVLGTTDELRHILRDRRPDELLIAIPSASGEVRQRIVEVARAERRPGEDAAGPARADLGRPQPRRPDPPGRRSRTCSAASRSRSTSTRSRSYLAGETVLVTGAGGSIGAELCRQIARARRRAARARRPLRARALRDRARARRRARLPAAMPVLADVGNRARCAQVFEHYRPGVVFHAAAYKHVPLMEANPVESVRNNVARDPDGRRGRGRVRRRAVRAHLDRQGAQPEHASTGQSQGALRVDRRGARRPRRRVRRASSPCASATCSARPASVIPIFRRQIERGGPRDRDRTRR